MQYLFSTRNLAFICLVLFYSVIVTVSQRNAFYVPVLLLFVLGAFALLKDGFKRQNESFSLSRDECKFLASFAFFTLSLLLMMHIWDMPGRRNKADLLFILAVPLYFVLRQIGFTAKQFFIAVAIGCAVVGVAGIYDVAVLNTSRAFEGRALILPASGIAMTLALMTLHVALRKVFLCKYVNAALLLSAFLGLVCVVLSGSRGVWFAFPLYCLVYFFAYFRLSFSKILILIASAILLALLLWFYPDSYFKARWDVAVSDLRDYYVYKHVNTSLGLRLEFWKSAWDGFLRSPIIGWGSDGYFALKETQVSEGLIDPVASNQDLYGAAHNQFLDALVRKGAIGFLALMAVLYFPLKCFVAGRKAQPSRDGQCLAELGFILVVTTVIYGLSDDFLHLQVSVWFYVVTCCVLIAIQSSRQPQGCAAEICSPGNAT